MDDSGKQFLDPAIVAKIEKSEKDDGMWLKDVPGDAVVSVHTRNSVYALTPIDRETGRVAMQGSGKHLPSPEICYLRGSTFGGSMIKVSWIGKGMCLEVNLASGGIMTTSIIRAITVEHDPGRVREMVAAAEKTTPKQITRSEFENAIAQFVEEKFPDGRKAVVRSIIGGFSLNGQVAIVTVLESAHRHDKFSEAEKLILRFMQEHWMYQPPEVRGDPNFTQVNAKYIEELYRLLKLPLPQ